MERTQTLTSQFLLAEKERLNSKLLSTWIEVECFIIQVDINIHVSSIQWKHNLLIGWATMSNWTLRIHFFGLTNYTFIGCGEKNPFRWKLFHMIKVGSFIIIAQATVGDKPFSSPFMCFWYNYYQDAMHSSQPRHRIRPLLLHLMSSLLQNQIDLMVCGGWWHLSRSLCLYSFTTIKRTKHEKKSFFFF